MMNISRDCNITADQVIQRLAQVSQTETKGECATPDGEGIILKTIGFDEKTVRFTIHYEISDEDMWLAIMKATFVLRELEGSCK